MKKKKKDLVKKDTWLINASKSRSFIIILGVILLISVYNNDNVLNTNPKKLYLIEWGVGLALFLLFMSYRFWKYADYYKRKFKDVVFALAFVAFTAFCTFFIFTLIQIPVLMYISHYAKKSPLETLDCEVINVITLDVDKIQFRFKGRKFSRYFDLRGIDDKDAEKNYLLRLYIRKSILDCYFLENMELVPK
jgi:hypothetical protein